MAREYSARRAAQRKNSGPRKVLVGLVTFLLGYFTATVVDLQTVSQWVNTQVFAHLDDKSAIKKKDPQIAEISRKPKFEFYTLLANDKVPSATQPNAQPLHVANNPTVGIPPDPLRKANTQQSIPTTATIAAKEVQYHKPQSKVQVVNAHPIAHSKNHAIKYLVQVAAFKALRDAEQLKGGLTLKGYSVAINSVTNATGNWYRVVVGPYFDRASAQSAQGILAQKEHLRGLISAG
jgi:cell division protein FtsN